KSNNTSIHIYKHIQMKNSKDYLLLNVNKDEDGAQTASESLTHRRHSHKVSEKEKDAMQAIESLDFTEIDNILLRKFNHDDQNKRNKVFKSLGKWVICSLIGIIVGIVVYCLKGSVDQLQELKFHSVEKYIVMDKSKSIPFFIYLSFNLLYSIISCVLVIIAGPLASSSGLPEVKGYLNGIRIRKAFNLKTFFGKLTSLIFAFSSMVVGPEGPMFHIGSCIGSSISQFKSKTLGIHFKRGFWVFQNDSDKRDFISCGAAAGIAAAFGAPIGGVLFALEEGSSFWSRQLTWRTFFSCLIATLTANFFLQGFGVRIHDYGVLTFGFSKNFLYTYYELVPFCIMGVIGGLLGALFVHLNVRINYYRKVYLGTRPVYRLVEVILVVILTSCIFYFPALVVPCTSVNQVMQASTDVCDVQQVMTSVQFFCPENYYNELASLTFTTSENALKLLYNRDVNIFNSYILLFFAIIYFILCTITSGTYVASGIFIPMMVIGGAWGRLFGKTLDLIMNVDASLYALIGSAAMMGGSLRMTISLVVIIVELTEGTQYLLPVILVVMISKWTGDAFNESIYEHLIELKHIPYLPSKPSRHMKNLTVSDVMAKEVVTLPEVVSVKTILEVLSNTTHNGFPVVLVPNLHQESEEDDNNNNNNNNGSSSSNININVGNGLLNSSINSDSDEKDDKILCGLILRNQLLVLIKNKVFSDPNHLDSINLCSRDGQYPLPIDHRTFVTELASSKFPTVSEVAHTVPTQDMDKLIDLRPYMNFAVVSIKNYSSLSEAYQLFRLVGLRHVVVVNVFNQIVGILTRKDL
ncbi:hypothetical protein SAMD00019534_095260, partial [Acytostelium subglobosum LB1]|uniref:hypothetical protein n=1 Tax=Acytostelium subglobosum LB1 TaxID=1410327 RepID=UPI000644A71F